jgi:hypothetical protein
MINEKGRSGGATAAFNGEIKGDDLYLFQSSPNGKIALTLTQRRIYDLVSRRPRTVDEIIAELWGVDPHDVPRRSAVKAHIWLAN